MVVEARGVSKIGFLKASFIILRELLVFELACMLLIVLLKDLWVKKSIFEQYFLSKIVSGLIEIYTTKIFLVIYQAVLCVFRFKRAILRIFILAIVVTWLIINFVDWLLNSYLANLLKIFSSIWGCILAHFDVVIGRAFRV